MDIAVMLNEHKCALLIQDYGGAENAQCLAHIALRRSATDACLAAADMDPAVREKRMEELLLDKKARLAALVEEARANPKASTKEADRFRAAYQHTQTLHQRWFAVYRAAGPPSPARHASFTSPAVKPAPPTFAKLSVASPTSLLVTLGETQDANGAVVTRFVGPPLPCAGARSPARSGVERHPHL